jgi:uncharacterized protein (TIGR02147 family)
MPVIYEYFDLLKFLRDDFNERHAKNPQYSLRAMAERLELNSGTVVRVMNGERNVSKNLLPVYTEYLGLRQKEAGYFKHLVNFCQAKSEKIRNEAYRELIFLRNGRTKTVQDDSYVFYEEWYFSAIREILRITKFNGDFKKLGNLLNPKLTVHETKRAIELLENLGFIDKTETGYVVRENYISTGEKWHGMAVKKFQKETIKKADEAIDRFPKEDRDFSTMTMCYSQDGFNKVKELLKRTREELSRIEEADSGKNRVFQINLNMFPLSVEIAGVKR